MQCIAEDKWKNEAFHANVVPWQPLGSFFHFVIVQIPVDLDDVDGSVRQQRVIWIEVKRQAADK